ncbi:unnamed protein product [Adineta steineri]|uniref:Uncharacterized protein n=1 Tax=Adineta steineri TaxID=433720 RepID=A0A819KV74_9BILA|nr:unnamed protein product [Adineta steineri]
MQRSISYDTFTFLLTEILPIIILICFILGLIGFIGNIFTFLQPNLRWNNCCIYMLCSSIVDIIHLTINILPSYLRDKYSFFGLPWNSSFLPQLSINLLLLSIIDGYACTCALTSWAHRLNQLKMVPRLILMMICISGIFSIYSPILGNDQPASCGYGEQNIYGILNIFFNGILQPIVILIFVLLTYRNIRQSRQRVGGMVKSGVNRFRNQFIVMIITQVLITAIFSLQWMIVQTYVLFNLRRVKTLDDLLLMAILFALSNKIYPFNNVKLFYFSILTSKSYRQTFVKDQAGLRQLIEIALKEPLPEQRLNVEEAKEQFIAFCRFKYNNNPDLLKQIDTFEANYREEDAIRWYTKNASFVNYIVSETCATSSATNYFNIRFILRDLYLQLQKLHDEQSSTWPEILIVHRGKVIPRIELDQLPKKDEYVMTRDFLSVSTDPEIANIFSSVGSSQNGSDEVSVIISMHIDREEVASKPIAFIEECSDFPLEKEVLLPMGIVLRIDSYKEILDDDSPCSVEIKMIRGKEEKEIEKKLSDSSRLVLKATAAAAVGGMVVGGAIAGLLKSLENEEDQEEFGKAMADVYESTEPDLAAKIEELTYNYDDMAAMVS